MTPHEHPESEHVMAWLDGELAADEQTAVRAHVETCAVCQTIAEDLRLVSRQLREWRVEPVPNTLDQVVSVASPAAPIPSTAPSRSRWFAWSLPRWGLGLAGAAAVALVAAVLVPQLRSPADGIEEQSDARLVPSKEQPAARQQFAAPGLGAAPNAQADTGVAANQAPASSQSLLAGLRIARTASAHVLVGDLDQARAAIEQFLTTHRGYAAQLGVSGQRPGLRTLVATLKVPPDQLDATLAFLRTIGRVMNESQGSEDVTSQSIDLEARIANARRTETRLAAVLENRTGRVSDVLEVEREIARVRGDIERMVAEQKQLNARVEMATVNVQVEEERRAGLTTPTLSIGRQLQNAAIDGVRDAIEFVISVALFALRVGPTILIWLTLLAGPFYLWWRRRRPAATGEI